MVLKFEKNGLVWLESVAKIYYTVIKNKVIREASFAVVYQIDAHQKIIQILGSPLPLL